RGVRELVERAGVLVEGDDAAGAARLHHHGQAHARGLVEGLGLAAAFAVADAHHAQAGHGDGRRHGRCRFGRWRLGCRRLGRRPGLATVLIATAAAQAALLALGAAAWTSTWMPHLVQDIVSWRPFLEQARQGLIPYVDFSKEYPVGGGMLYWLLARIVEPADTRRTVLVHALLMSAVDVFNAGLFYRIAAGIERRRALIAALAFALNPTALLLGPVRYEGLVVTLVLVGYAQHRRDRPLRAVL